MASSSHTNPSYPSTSLSTPALTPSFSATTSPAQSEIRSPDLNPIDPFVLGESLASGGVEGLPAGFGYDGFEKGVVDVEAVDKMPECWGHRGASATFPENTRASFVEACKAGADGIETDFHITTDNILVLFHDPKLGRTTTGSGRIDEQPWHGVLEHVRTVMKPVQPIPRFEEVLDIMLAPGNERIKLNIDCKVENDPTRLFSLIKDRMESYLNWQTSLAPRLILGIWHPKFIVPASTILPFLPRYAITMSIPQARSYFFPHVHGFSVLYPALASAEGAKFRAECAREGKNICAWTVNDKEEMRNCARWGLASVISDKPALWREVKAEIIENRKKALQPTLGTYVLPFLSYKNWWFNYEREAREETEYLEREGGKFDEVVVPPVSLRIVSPSDIL